MRHERAGDCLIIGYLLGLFALHFLQFAAPVIVFFGVYFAGLGFAGSWCAAAAAGLTAWPPLIRMFSERAAATQLTRYGAWTEAEVDSYFSTGRGRNIRCPCPVMES